MKHHYTALLGMAFLFTGTAATAQDDTQAKIKTILETLAAQEEVIQQQADLITKLTGELKAVTAVAARLETALPADGSLWLKGQKVIDEGGGWHRSYGNTGWYNGTYGGGWHMSDDTWIRSYGGKNVYVDKAIRADDGFQIDGQTVIDSDAGWHRSYGNTGWYNGTHGGGWFMADNVWVRSYGSKNVYVDKVIRADDGFQVDDKQVIDADAGWHRSYGNTGWYNGTHGGGWHMSDGSWIRSYGGKDVYVDKMIRADNGFQVDGRERIDGGGNILVSPRYSQEYTWYQGDNPIKMQPENQYACYLMSVSGYFAGGGEKVRVYSEGGWWYLGGHSQKHGVHATARCVTFR